MKRHGKQQQDLALHGTGPSQPAGPARGLPASGAEAELDAEVSGLYVAHGLSLARYAITLTHDRDTAAEAVQEGFLRYVQVRQAGEVITAPRAWLYRVIRNYLLDKMRNNGRCPAEPLKTPVAGSETDPDSMLALAGLEEELRKTLSPRELECSLLRSSGFRYEEIAAAMNLRPGTVGAMLSRATRKVNRLRVERPPAPAAHHSE